MANSAIFKPMKNNYLLLFCILLSPIFVFAQQFVVKGKVTDSDGQPIPFVSVFIKGTTKGVSANVDGIYSINVERGMVTLSFTVVGFKTATQTVDVFDNITVNKTLQT